MRATADQDEIGWQHFINGRISKLWRLAQEEWLSRVATRWKTTGSRWAKEVTKAILELNWSMWEHRNHIYHDPQHPWNQQNHREVQQQIRDQFDHYSRELFLPADRWLFEKTPVHTLLKNEPDFLSNWLTSVSAAYQSG